MVRLEPGRQLLPTVICGILAITWPIVCMKPVWSAGIDFEFRLLARRLQRSLHRLHLRDRDALVCLAIKTEHWGLHVWRKFGRALWPNGLLCRGIHQRAIK